MTANELRVEGELYLSLEAVAEIYSVQVVWLRTAYDAGLLGRGLDRDRTVWIAAVQLDRVATVVRLRAIAGQDVDALGLLLADREDEA